MCYVDIDWAAIEDDDDDRNICPDCNFLLTECTCHDHLIEDNDDTCDSCGCSTEDCVCYTRG